MKTASQVESQFRAELQSLLDKYRAELEARDHWEGYSECGEDVRMTVTIPAVYCETTHDCLQEWTEIDLRGGVYPSKQEQSS